MDRHVASPKGKGFTTNDTETTQICPLCAEVIKAAAKVCPHCQTQLTRWGGLRASAGVLSVVAMLFCVGALCFWILAPDEPFLGRDFARHRRELEVVRVSLDRTKVRNDWWISGFVTNHGPGLWRVKELEVRFVDAQDRLLDVLHPGIVEPFLVGPGQEHAFRLNLGTRDWTHDAVQPRVRVQLAVDGRTPSSD